MGKVSMPAVNVMIMLEMRTAKTGVMGVYFVPRRDKMKMLTILVHVFRSYLQNGNYSRPDIERP